MPGVRAPVDIRFWSKVHSTGSCWEWQGHVNKTHGYGQFDWRFALRAHRAAWLLIFGPIPEELQVLHKCDNKRCVRPSHLFLGTQKTNVHDCVAKGRISRGEHRPQHKLTTKDVIEIRRAYAAGELGYRLLSAKFGVRPCRIYEIVQRRAWRHVQ